MRDPILASKFNGLQLFFCETLTVPVSLTAEFRNKDIKAFRRAFLISVQINAVPARGMWQILPNVTISF